MSSSDSNPASPDDPATHRPAARGPRPADVAEPAAQWGSAAAQRDPAASPRGSGAGRRSGGERPTVLRFAGAGVELAGMVLGAGFLGHLLDRYLLAMDRPWGLIGGALLGFAAGMGHLFVLAQRFNR